MARVPNEKAAKAEAMYRDGMKLVDIARKLDVPPGTVRRWKSTYHWDGNSKKKQNERSDNKSERSDKSETRHRGGQIGNNNALKNATYASEYWKNISDEERAMMADMPTDEEFMLIETLKLATLRERRYMALLARYNELLKNSPDGMILKEDIRVLTKESNAFGKCVSSKQHQTVTAQQTKVDAIEQMQIIESELTRVQKLKIKTLESLAKIRAGKATHGDSELIDDWIKAVEGCEDDD